VKTSLAVENVNAATTKLVLELIDEEKCGAVRKLVLEIRLFYSVTYFI
jgi:hypothetical protein